jgi:hypothetical protein
MKTNKRCPKTGRFLPRQPRLVSAFVAGHNAAVREARAIRALNLATQAVALAGLVAGIIAFSVALSAL